MADFNEPTNTSLYSGIWSTVRSLIASLAKMDFASDTNIPTNTKRWDSSTKKFQYWNGSSWADLDVNFGNAVGIKTTSPGSDLDVGSGTGSVAPNLRLNGGTGTGSGGNITFANAGTLNTAIGAYSGILGGTQNNALLLYCATGGEIRMITNGGSSESMRLASGGQVYFQRSTLR